MFFLKEMNRGNNPAASLVYYLKIVSPCLFWALFFTNFSSAAMQQLTYFQGTESELNVYKIHGVEEGKTLLIIGGIQGNEPGGYLAADLYVDMSLKKGNLIVVPRANFYSIVRNQRGVNGDMNRKFAVFSDKGSDDRIVNVLKQLMAESDYLLNLHDGSGFYSEKWESNLRNPKRYGQSIIGDCDQYQAKGRKIVNLGDMARKVCNTVNPQIENQDYHFHFNNHRTADADTIHAEQRRSATYYALTQHEIPAFGIETSKNIPSYKLRVKFQTMIINAFMKEFGIIPEHPKIYLDPPKLEYLVVMINNADPLVVYDKQKLYVKKGDFVEISHIEANYERGLSVDILKVGNSNDYRKCLQIKEPTEVIVKKDKYRCGGFSILPGGATPEYAAATKRSDPPLMKYLIFESNQKTSVVENGGHMKVIRGDLLKITDVITTLLDQTAVKVNFKGFVGDTLNNTGEDRGYLIDTSRDLWKRYSKGGLGTRYPVVVKFNDREIGKVWIDFIEPHLEYVIVKLNGGLKMCYAPREVIRTCYDDRIEIVDVKTNITDNYGVKVNFKGFAGDGSGEDRGVPIALNDTLVKSYSLDEKGSEYEIVVRRGRTLLGTIKVCISFRRVT